MKYKDGIFCINSDCKNYWEDGFWINKDNNKSVVPHDSPYAEDCPSFKEGVHDFYREEE